MTKKVGFYTETLGSTCGVGLAFGFEFDDDDCQWGMPDLIIGEDEPEGGAGWFVAGFIDKDEQSRAAYRGFRKHYKLVFQSPVRVNTNSGNDFFFCVFDKRDDPSVKGRRARYPFKQR